MNLICLLFGHRWKSYRIAKVYKGGIFEVARTWWIPICLRCNATGDVWWESDL